MKLFCLVEECDDYNPDDKLQKKYHDWAILGLLDRIDYLEKKVKGLQSRMKMLKLNLKGDE